LGQTLEMHGPNFQTKFSHGINGQKIKAGDPAVNVHDADNDSFSFAFCCHHVVEEKAEVKAKADGPDAKNAGSTRKKDIMSV